MPDHRPFIIDVERFTPQAPLPEMLHLSLRDYMPAAVARLAATAEAEGQGRVEPGSRVWDEVLEPAAAHANAELICALAGLDPAKCSTETMGGDVLIAVDDAPAYLANGGTFACPVIRVGIGEVARVDG